MTQYSRASNKLHAAGTPTQSGVKILTIVTITCFFSTEATNRSKLEELSFISLSTTEQILQQILVHKFHMPHHMFTYMLTTPQSKMQLSYHFPSVIECFVPKIQMQCKNTMFCLEKLTLVGLFLPEYLVTITTTNSYRDSQVPHFCACSPACFKFWLPNVREHSQRLEQLLTSIN